ncbi:MAG: MFS transporter [Prevotellaceae bacterium]|jgi:maltose/moltooligosaccharide transporter|nr:MFS transporter [Prevotellaceae bacterium]
METKPNLRFWPLWNMSFGFMGVQVGYALQNANTSRLLQSLGADVHELSYFWLAPPLAGLIVQPLVGLFSDGTWTRVGRRIPFILGGAVLAALTLLLMPNAELFVTLMAPLAFAAIMLLFMDMSFNVTMQPFRALVADMLNDSQKTKGYSVQTFLINCGAVIGSVLPFVLVHWFGLSNRSTPEARIPESVIWSYYIGGALLLITVLVTAVKTREYPPAQFLKYRRQTAPSARPGLGELIRGVPKVMLQLGVVQFFSWSALFLLWTYTTPAIAANVWATDEIASAAYHNAGDWVGILFGVYAVFAGLFSIVIPRLSRRCGNKAVYSASLLCGAAGYLGLALLHDQWLLLLPMLGVGIAWGAILALPYSILSKSVQEERMGVYMGVFNFTITLPQICCGLIGGTIVSYFFHGSAVAMIMVAAGCMAAAALSVAIVQEKKGACAVRRDEK